MTQKLTIAGKQFEVEPRYAEGHVLTANEAATLNQTFFENIRNNFAGKAKEDGTQEDLDKYVASYKFGERTGGGGGSRDPIEVEALNLARDAVRKAITTKGGKIADFTAKAISEAAAKLVEANPVYREKAKERVEQMQSIASDSIDPSIMEALTAAAKPEGDAAEPDASGEATTEASTETTETEAPATGRRRGKSAE